MSRWFSSRIVCRRAIALEQLEERIVLDAACDCGGQDGQDSDDSQVQQNPTEETNTDGQPADPDTAAGGPSECPDPLGEIFNQDLSVVLISNALAELDALANAAVDEAEVVIYDAANDDLASIVEELRTLVDSTGEEIGHLAILSHGDSGELRLSSIEFVTVQSVSADPTDWLELGGLFADEARFDIYGCSVGSGEGGIALVEALSDVTGAVVWASDDATGNVDGADWLLEVRSAENDRSDLIDEVELEDSYVFLNDDTINDPGFESGSLSSWNTSISGAADGKLYVTDQESHTGDKCAYKEGDYDPDINHGYGEVYFNQYITLDPSRVAVSFYIKGDIQGNDKFRVGFGASASDASLYNGHVDEADWANWILPFNSSHSGQQRLTFSATGYGGEFWIDDIDILHHPVLDDSIPDASADKGDGDFEYDVSSYFSDYDNSEVPDYDTLTYELGSLTRGGGYTGDVTIDASTGIVTIEDTDETGWVDVQVRAKDQTNCVSEYDTFGFEWLPGNEAPTVDLTVDPLEVTEGGSVEASFVIVDPDSSVFDLEIDWGDGNSETHEDFNPSAVLTHIYSDDDPTSTASDNYTITATVSDRQDTDSDTKVVTVNNAAPAITLSPSNGSPEEGEEITLTYTITDPGTDDTFDVEIDWGDTTAPFTAPHSSTGTYTATHTYAENGDYTISATVVDDDTGQGTNNTSVQVQNVGPEITLSPSDSSPEEGEQITLTYTITDPGIDDTFDVEIAWGDTTALFTAHHSSAGTYTATHTYADNYDYTISATVVDDDGGQGTNNTSVQVQNVAPTVVLDPVTAIDENEVATLTGTITDPGTLDTFILNVDWGDPGSPNNMEQYSFGPSAAGSQLFTLTHRYDNPTAPPQTFTITATVTDDDADSGSDTTTVEVEAVNDDPVNTVPASGTHVIPVDSVDQPIRGVSVSDIDVNEGDGQVRVTLTASEGTMKLGGVGVTIVGNGTGAVVATGLIDNVNNALAALTFTPPTDYLGDVTITVTSNDLGNWGKPGAGADTDTFEITVTDIPETLISLIPFNTVEVDPVKRLDTTEPFRSTVGPAPDLGNLIELLDSQGLLRFAYESNADSGTGDESGALSEFEAMLMQSLFGEPDLREQAWENLFAFVKQPAVEQPEWLNLQQFLGRLHEWQVGKTFDEILLVFNAGEIELAEWFHSQIASANWLNDNHAGETAMPTGPWAKDKALVFDLDNIRVADLFTSGSDIGLFDRLDGHSPKLTQSITRVYDLNEVSIVAALAS